ncbi:tRNA guanosine(34) transglycosylase Tgt [Candidatus Peregrinibacteria bacterium]|nr:tRNA guanosine(34) transglycosylase Tgt [Candidatus Peregrinibacteria bacterium]
MFKFFVQAKSPNTSARAGILEIPHGKIHSPFFMPIGTTGFVKTLTPDELKSLGAEIILANTYHLYLRPGDKNIKKFGGLHKWMGWNGPILTDSGGYQIFSLYEGNTSHQNKSDFKTHVRVHDSGVEFKSHIDGSIHFLTPRDVIKIQNNIGADIIMALDECIPHHADKKYAARAMKRTHDWALQCKKAHKNPRQALFPIIQGGMYKNLRIESAKFISDLDLPGIAIGGLSVGETKKQMYEILETIMPILPKNKPIYLMGVGSPEDLLEAIDRGVDMFDCVMPTRLARHGSFWTLTGRRNIKNSKYRLDQKPLMENCGCYTCQKFTRSYLRHLFTEHETLGLRLMTIHNLHFLLNLMRDARTAITKGKFRQFKKAFLAKFKAHAVRRRRTPQ